MSTERVDQYIAKSAPFARPILAHIRAVVHAAAPDIVEEIKWSSPFFTQDGQIVCAMSAFKAHCGLFFWKGALVVPEKENKGEGMGQFGKLTSVDQLPPAEVLAGYVRKALALNAAGVPAPHVVKRRNQKTKLQKTSSQKTRTQAAPAKGAAKKGGVKKPVAKKSAAKPAAKKSSTRKAATRKPSPKK